MGKFKLNFYNLVMKRKVFINFSNYKEIVHLCDIYEVCQNLNLNIYIKYCDYTFFS